MSKTTEAAKLARTLRRLGFVVECKNGHYRVKNVHGHLLVTFSSSPSDFFWLTHVRHDCEKKGIRI